MRTTPQQARHDEAAHGSSSSRTMMKAASLLLAGLRTGNTTLLRHSGTSAIEAMCMTLPESIPLADIEFIEIGPR
jgi:hypothetical protein